MTTSMSSCRAYTDLAARILISVLFLLSGLGKVVGWSHYEQVMTGMNLPLVPLFLAGAIAFELGGGAAILVGFRTRWAAGALIAFLVPATLMFHNFWAFEGSVREGAMLHFLKNLAIMGGLLKFAADGAGRLSIDGCCGVTTEATTETAHPGEPARVPAG